MSIFIVVTLLYSLSNHPFIVKSRKTMLQCPAETLDFDKLPEACISHVLSLTSPADSCRSSVVSTSFKSAVNSDTVWGKFLPSDYQEILNRTDKPIEWSSKRDLYFRLCDPILIDGGKMSFQLHKSSGAKCYMISSKQLKISWGDDPRYWAWIPTTDTRFPEVASLLIVCWLEIHGTIDSKMLTPKTKYVAYLVYKLDEHTRGLGFPPQEASVKIGMHESKRSVTLNPDNQEDRENYERMVGNGLFSDGEMETSGDCGIPSRRQDGWLEIEIGEFYNDDSDDSEIDMCLMEDEWQGKCGLLVLGIEVRPKA